MERLRKIRNAPTDNSKFEALYLHLTPLIRGNKKLTPRTNTLKCGRFNSAPLRKQASPGTNYQISSQTSSDDHFSSLFRHFLGTKEVFQLHLPENSTRNLIAGAIKTDTQKISLKTFTIHSPPQQTTHIFST